MKYIFEISDTPDNVRFPVVMHSKLDNGIKTKKQAIGISSMIEALQCLYEQQTEVNNDIGFNEEIIEEQNVTPNLPFGTLYYQSGKIIRNPNLVIEELAVVLPKGIYPASYLNEGAMIGFPTLLFVFKVTLNINENTRKVRSAEVYAVKESALHRINDKTPLFTFPFPNVSKGNNKICWGNTIASTSETSLSEIITKAIDSFVSSNFNDDYGILMASTNYGTFGDYLKLHDNQDFNDELLIPSSVANLKEIRSQAKL